MSDDVWTLGGRTLRSRLLLGTARYPSRQILLDALREAGTEIVTVAVRRVSPGDRSGTSLYDALAREGYALLPNTAGCYSARDAVLTAELAREALGTSWIKLEVLADDETLLPDVLALLDAARTLVEAGFQVLPYTNDDPVTAQKLEDAGCAAVMPLGAPIGSGLGIRNPANIRIILESVSCPVIVDAGVGTASDAAIAMELGCTAVLMSTGIAAAKDPVKMAHAMKLAVEAGRAAYEAGRMPRRLHAQASSPETGLADLS